MQALSASAAAPFDRPEWFAAVAETGIAPLIVTASDGDNAAALALTEAGGRITPLRNWYAFTWRSLGIAGKSGDALLTAIATSLKARAYRVTLEPVPDEDGAAEQLAQAFRHAGWQVVIETCDTNHILPVAGRSFADYWGSRPGALRSTLKRKVKKVETQVLTYFDPAVWDEYEAIYAASWKPTEDHPAMLRAFAEAEGAAGRLRLGVARAQGLAIAAQCWTVENSIAYIHKLAHLESHRHLSAGTTLSAALFQHLIDKDKVALIDFGTGDQSYKADWMEAVRPRFRIDCLNPAAPRAWARWPSGGCPAAMRDLRQCLHACPRMAKPRAHGRKQG
ncbi:MAG: GNAT family N-acetyltransferase [Rhizobiales bacterium]|nr:GNAT family N-acetyltransferase [Hyphomicrobiales bacterium]